MEQISCAGIRLFATRLSKSINFSLSNTPIESETDSVLFWFISDPREIFENKNNDFTKAFSPAKNKEKLFLVAKWNRKL